MYVTVGYYDDRTLNSFFHHTAQHPCDSLKCGLHEHCTLDTHGVATCGCGAECEAIVRSVCGTDGRTYDSPCFLERAACLESRDIRVAYMGACGELYKILLLFQNVFPYHKDL